MNTAFFALRDGSMSRDRLFEVLMDHFRRRREERRSGLDPRPIGRFGIGRASLEQRGATFVNSTCTVGGLVSRDLAGRPGFSMSMVAGGDHLHVARPHHRTCGGCRECTTAGTFTDGIFADALDGLPSDRVRTEPEISRSTPPPRCARQWRKLPARSRVILMHGAATCFALWWFRPQAGPSPTTTQMRRRAGIARGSVEADKAAGFNSGLMNRSMSR